MSATPVIAPRRGRRLGGWLALAGVLAVAGLIGALLAQSTQWAQRDALDPESPGPTGARAVARVLAAEGVRVEVVRDRAAAAAAVDDDALLVLPDAPALSDDEIEALAAAAGDVVLIRPRSRTLDLLLPGSSPAGASDDAPIPAACDAPAIGRTREIVAGSLYTPGTGVTACFATVDGAALLLADSPTGTVAAVDGTALLSNENIDRADNAALALTLLGARPRVVWYMPSLGDGDGAAPTLGELTPGWVTPAVVLLLAAAAAAAGWRGRRFGPLVAENLPVTVRASETAAGRARLYARAGDPAHALDRLRADALTRLARALGLGTRTPAGAIADAAARRIGADTGEVRGILIDTVPRNDRDLVDLADRLRDLQARVRAAVRYEGDPR